MDELVIEELTRQQDPNDWRLNWGSHRDTLVVWFNESVNYDSLWVRLKSDDLEDTLFLTKPGDSGRGKTKKKQEDDKPFALKSNAKPKLKHFKPWKLTAKAPLDTNVDWSRIVFTEGSDTIAIEAKVDNATVIISHAWKQDKNYALLIPDSTLFDIYGRSHDTLSFSVTTTRQEDFGEALIAYELPDAPQYIWELLGAESKLIERRIVQAPEGVISHKHLAPGSYQLRLVLDANENGVWDTGLYPVRQPETVIYFDQSVDVRGNWVTELNWLLMSQSK